MELCCPTTGEHLTAAALNKLQTHNTYKHVNKVLNTKPHQVTSLLLMLILQI